MKFLPMPDRSVVFAKEIKPLIHQVRALCKKHRMPFCILIQESQSIQNIFIFTGFPEVQVGIEACTDIYATAEILNSVPETCVNPVLSKFMRFHEKKLKKQKANSEIISEAELEALLSAQPPAAN